MLVIIRCVKVHVVNNGTCNLACIVACSNNDFVITCQHIIQVVCEMFDDLITGEISIFLCFFFTFLAVRLRACSKLNKHALLMQF